MLRGILRGIVKGCWYGWLFWHGKHSFTLRDKMKNRITSTEETCLSFQLKVGVSFNLQNIINPCYDNDTFGDSGLEESSANHYKY